MKDYSPGREELTARFRKKDIDGIIWKNDEQVNIYIEMDNQEMTKKSIVPAINKFLDQLRREKVI